MDNEKIRKDLTEVTEDSYFSAKVESWSRLVLRRFCRNKMAVVGMVALLAMMLCCVAAPIICKYSPTELHTDELVKGRPIPPGAKYIFGTDSLGRDYFARTVYGGRVSLLVGFCAIVISLGIGIPLGCFAGYYGGAVDWVISRVIDLLSCIPTFFLILIANAMLPPSILNVIIIIGIFGWMGIARQVRAQFLSLRNQDFVQGAFALGFSDRRVIFKHILPNALTPVIVNASMSVAGAIMYESSLSYLGMGIQEPNPSWGSMLNQSQKYLTKAPWLAIIPGVCISIVSLSLNFIGDGLRDALDPRTIK